MYLKEIKKKEEDLLYKASQGEEALNLKKRKEKLEAQEFERNKLVEKERKRLDGELRNEKQNA